VKNKKAQVTMFVIIGILIVVTIVLFLYFKKQPEPGRGGKSESNPVSVFESCLEDKVKETVKTISEQGGYLNNTLNITFRFNDTGKILDISYLCYTSREFTYCTNQEPMLINHLEEEVGIGISAQVRMCFDEITKSIGKQGEIIEARYNGFDVEIIPSKIIVNVNGEIISTKSGETTKQTGIRGMFSSKLYEITRVVQEITTGEATRCWFDFSKFMIYYPEFEISKAMTRNATAIYTIKHNKGMDEFNFAVRSCSVPAGF